MWHTAAAIWVLDTIPHGDGRWFEVAAPYRHTSWLGLVTVILVLCMCVAVEVRDVRAQRDLRGSAST